MISSFACASSAGMPLDQFLFDAPTLMAYALFSIDDLRLGVLNLILDRAHGIPAIDRIPPH